MRFNLNIVLLFVFVALIAFAQRSALNAIITPSYSSSLDSASQQILQLQSELVSIHNRLQMQMDNKELHNDNTNENGNAALEATLSKLEKLLKEQQQQHDKLQLRVNSWMNYNSNPYLGMEVDRSLCHNRSKLDEFGCSEGKDMCPGLFDHEICLDHFPPPRDCIVYDFGIRENPEFGKTLLEAPFHCQVFAFDPSPITKKWYASQDAEALRNHPNYTLFEYGAGGVDGTVKLNEYDWGQVSILRFPLELKPNCSNTPGEDCEMDQYAYQRKSFDLPVHTLDYIMKKLGHEHIDILKVDVEGSEYMFLEHALENGNLQNVNQLTVEWHHFDFDSRYGGGSTPSINMLVALLNKVGLYQFDVHSDIGGWPGVAREFWEKKITLRYNLASFVRV